MCGLCMTTALPGLTPSQTLSLGVRTDPSRLFPRVTPVSSWVAAGQGQATVARKLFSLLLSPSPHEDLSESIFLFLLFSLKGKGVVPYFSAPSLSSQGAWEGGSFLLSSR